MRFLFLPLSLAFFGGFTVCSGLLDMILAHHWLFGAALLASGAFSAFRAWRELLIMGGLAERIGAEGLKARP
jgi:heme A synthase